MAAQQTAQPAPDRMAAGALLGDVTRWSRQAPVGLDQVIGAAVGMGGPVLYGVVFGHLAQAMMAAIGALGASGIAVPPGARRRAVHLVSLVGVVAAAGLVGASIAGRGWTMAGAVVAIAFVVLVAGGFSRPAAEMSTRFVTFVVITTGLGASITATGSDAWQVAERFALGAGWTAGAALLLVPVTRMIISRWGHPRAEGEPPAGPVRSLKVRLRYWRKSLRSLRGWQYPVRLSLCLAVAEVTGVFWHQPKAYWIAVTVVIVVQRRLDAALVRVAARGLGTTVGVLAGSALVLWSLPSWLFVLVVAVLGGLRPFLKARNYALYSVVMTPLVVLLLDFGQTASAATIGYRLADTVIGCAIAFGVGYLPGLRFPSLRVIPARSGGPAPH
jgi:hypothetical protein